MLLFLVPCLGAGAQQTSTPESLAATAPASGQAAVTTADEGGTDFAPSAAAEADKQAALHFRGRPDGAIEVWSFGTLRNVIEPGEIPFTAPSPEALHRLRATDEADTAFALEQAELASQELEAQEQAQELAQQEAAARQRQAQQEAFERATIESSAVSVLNGNTGEYVRIAPLSVLRQRLRPEELADKEKVTVFNRMTGGNVVGVPVETPAPAPETEE
jgi:hypothetical protein